MKNCSNCEWHEWYWDEIDGEQIDDGCVCHRKPEGTHAESCHTDKAIENCIDCPVWEKKE